MVKNAIERMESHASPQESHAGVGGRIRAVTPSSAATAPATAAAETASTPPPLVGRSRNCTATSIFPPDSSESPESQPAGNRDELGAATALGVSNGDHGRRRREQAREERSLSDAAATSSLECLAGCAAAGGGGKGSGDTPASSKAAEVAETTAAAAGRAMRSPASGAPSKTRGSCTSGGGVSPEGFSAVYEEERRVVPGQGGGEGGKGGRAVSEGSGVVAEEEKDPAGDAAEGGKAAGRQPKPIGVVDGSRYDDPEGNRRESNIVPPAVAGSPSSERGPHTETAATAGARDAEQYATGATDSAAAGALGLPAAPCPVPACRITSRLNPQAAPFTFNPGAGSDLTVSASSAHALLGVNIKKPAGENPLAPAATGAPVVPVPTAPAAAVPSTPSTRTGLSLACSPSPVPPACGGSGGDKKGDGDNSDRGDRATGAAVSVPGEDRTAPRAQSSGAPAVTRRPPEDGVVSKAEVVARGRENMDGGLAATPMVADANGAVIGGFVGIGGGDRGVDGGGSRGGSGGGCGCGSDTTGGGGGGSGGGGDGVKGGRKMKAKKAEELKRHDSDKAVGATSAHLPVRERRLSPSTGFYRLPSRPLSTCDRRSNRKSICVPGVEFSRLRYLHPRPPVYTSPFFCLFDYFCSDIRKRTHK